MKRKVLAAMVAALFTLLLVNSAFAYTVPSDTVVYVTPTGSKYHREDCTYIKNSCRALTISSAEGQGYGACSRCEPDVLTGQYVSNWDGDSGDGGGGTGEKSEPPVKAESSPTDKHEASNLALIVLLIVFVGPYAIIAFCLVIGAIKYVIETPKRKAQKAKELQEKQYAEEIARQQFEQQKDEYTALYGGRTAEESAGMPDWAEIGSDGLPKEKKTKGWGRRYTCYVTKSGKCYHTKYGCSGARIPMHASRVKWSGKSACSRCGGRLPDLQWYTKYQEIKWIKKKYGIE